MTIIDLSPVVSKIDKDARKALATLNPREARYLVDTYYQMQEQRKRAENQLRSMEDEPHSAIEWLFEQSTALENRIKSMLKVYADCDPIGAWSQTIVGIGPVISAGLLAHIDITKAPTVGHIWRFAGLDPTQTWGKGKKRPWNASLKTLCWKIGESFVKVCNKPKAFYGHVYLERKGSEIERNEAGEFADQAAAKLAKYKIDKTTEAYKHYSAGKLPDAHIHARAKRYAVKLFLSHWHDRAYREHYGAEPPLPYPISHLGHAHKIEVPG